jgi:hypothetical protein
MNILTRVLPSLVQCCARCSALLDNNVQISYPGTDIRVTAQGCGVCALLLRQARCDWRSQDDGDIDIVRRGATLQERATHAPLLRLCCDTGLSSTPCP